MSQRVELERDAGRGKLLFLDAFSGIAGDMLLSALIDLGVPENAVATALRALPVAGYRLQWSQRKHSGIAARHLSVELDKPQGSRDHAAIQELLDRAQSLPHGARVLSKRAFLVLAEAEARVHATTVEHVHFHEVGAVDSIVDIVGACFALDYLGADVVCSPLPIGRGMVRSQHGAIPSPAPATALCLSGVPTYDAGIDAELVTPTGACLVKAAATRFSRWPQIRPLAVGHGAGSRTLADRPNVLRAVLGEDAAPSTMTSSRSSHVVLELNVDDTSGELAAVALERALEAGALDVWSTPIGMKKGRPALMLSALAPRAAVDAVAAALLSESSSLGLRLQEVDRIERPRRSITVDTPFGEIPLKVADSDGLPPNVAPEFEPCRAAARHHGVALKQVYAAAIAAYIAQGT